MKTNIFKFIVLSVLSSFVFVSCSSTTRINSTPRGAKVYIDGEYKGFTPYSLTDKKPAWGATEIKLTKDGYRDFNVTIQKGEQFSVGACIGGCFVLVPFAWIMNYKPARTFELEKQKESIVKK